MDEQSKTQLPLSSTLPVVFTTIQKFNTENEKYPQLSDRRNIVFIADEAHRSQYGLKARLVVKPAKQKGEIYPLKPQASLLAAEASNSYQLHHDSLPDSEGDRAYTSYGFAKYLRDALPNASFIGFTGTLIESTDKNTPAVFGDYIDIYDIQRAVEDGATVGSIPFWQIALRLEVWGYTNEVRPGGLICSLRRQALFV